MEFRHIFGEDRTKAWLWAVCYPEHNPDGGDWDIFSHLFENWSDTEYLQKFFLKNKAELAKPIYRLSIEAAVDQVLKEVEIFESQLQALESGSPVEDIKWSDVFEPLHEGVYALKATNIAEKKGKPHGIKNPMLRIYAIELGDGCYVVTGGAIKLVDRMQGDEFEKELSRIHQVHEYIRDNKIASREGLYC